VPLSDLPLSVMFLFFLLLFLLIDLYPGGKKSTAKIRKLFERHDKQEEPDTDIMERDQTAPFADQQAKLQLNDFESIVLRRLAQNCGKGFSRKQINADLHLESSIFNETLESLLRKGLVRMALTSLFGIRCYLSEKGRDYLIEQGFIPRILGRTGRPFNT